MKAATPEATHQDIFNCHAHRRREARLAWTINGPVSSNLKPFYFHSSYECCGALLGRAVQYSTSRRSLASTRTRLTVGFEPVDRAVSPWPPSAAGYLSRSKPLRPVADLVLARPAIDCHSRTQTARVDTSPGPVLWLPPLQNKAGSNQKRPRTAALAPIR